MADNNRNETMNKNNESMQREQGQAGYGNHEKSAIGGQNNPKGQRNQSSTGQSGQSNPTGQSNQGSTGQNRENDKNRNEQTNR